MHVVRPYNKEKDMFVSFHVSESFKGKTPNTTYFGARGG